MSTKKNAGDAVVNVRALHREGYDGFWRGGVKWSSGPDGTTAKVTPALLEKLYQERMLSVREVDDPSFADAEPIDVPQSAMVDPQARELEIQEAEAKRLDALERAADLAKKNAERRAKLGLPEPTAEQASKANQAAASAAAAAEARGKVAHVDAPKANEKK